MKNAETDFGRRFESLAKKRRHNKKIFKRYRAVRSGVKIAYAIQNSPSNEMILDRVAAFLSGKGKYEGVQYASEMVKKGKEVVAVTYRGPARAWNILKVSRTLPK